MRRALDLALYTPCPMCWAPGSRATGHEAKQPPDSSGASSDSDASDGEGFGSSHSRVVVRAARVRLAALACLQVLKGPQDPCSPVAASNHGNEVKTEQHLLHTCR